MARHLGEDLISHSPWRISERGPWQSKEDPTFWYVDVISGGLRVARVSGVGRDRALANAQLIVVAPGLLARLKQSLVYLDHPDVRAIPFVKNSEVMANQAREIIEEAEG